MINYKSRICKRCGNPFNPSNSTQSYCVSCRTFICKFCKREFSVNSKIQADQNPSYCSKECFYKSRSYILICQNCGKQFTSKGNNTKFCLECRTLKCKVCGKIFVISRSQRISHAKYCSRKCMLSDPLHLLHERTCKKCNETFKSVSISKLCNECKTLVCDYCGKDYVVRSYKTYISKYCSKECYDKSRISREWTDEDKKFINNHYLKDMTLNDIALHFNVSKKSLYNEILRSNIKRREPLTKKDIIQEIQDIYKKGIPLNYTNMRSLEKGKLLTSAWHQFGSWKEAIEKAGLNYDKINLYGYRKNWTTENILDTIKDLYDSGVSLRYTHIKEKYNDLYVATTQNKELGSWKNALEILGIDYDDIKGSPWGTKYNSEDGNIYYSILEGRVADLLYEYKRLNLISKYKSQVRVKEGRAWTCDFLIFFKQKNKIWMEVDGLRDKRDIPYLLKTNSGKTIIYSEKIQFYNSNNYNYIIVNNVIETEEFLNHYVNN